MGHRHSRHNTQRQQLLAELKAVSPDWLPLRRVMELGGPQYGARIFELRALGHRIENEPGRFRLLVNPPPLVTLQTQSQTINPAESGPDSLFPDPDPAEMRHRDDG